jgi:hypothetical protein
MACKRDDHDFIKVLICVYNGWLRIRFKTTKKRESGKEKNRTIAERIVINNRSEM